LLLTVLDQTHDCIKLLSIDGKIQFVNRQGAMAMDLTAPSEILGQSYMTRWPAENTFDVAAALSEAREERLGHFAAPRTGPDGSLTWWDVRISPVCDRTGSITHLVSIARDLTSEIMERKRVEAISLEMRHRLKNAMTVAGGIFMLSARGSPEANAFATEVVSRLSQLGAVQAHLMDPAADKSLPQVVRSLAVAYGSGAKIDFGNLPDVQLSDTSMQALSLCYGELATTASNTVR
jgi:PAS domain S-box-containing protein